MFTRYRILEINGVFIPQYKECFLGSWEGISDYYTWRALENMKEICSKLTIEEAKIVIDKHREKIKIHKY